MRERRLRIGMRWWLAAAFAAVAAITALAVVSVLNSRSEHAFRRHAEEFAVGATVAAAEALKHDRLAGVLRAHTASLASTEKIALFVFDRRGRRLTGSVSNGTRWQTLPDREAALRAGLASNRFIAGAKDGSALVVGLRIHGGVGAALVAYSLRPELRTQLGIVRNEFFQSALIAFVLGAAAGLIVAALTGRRLARIARAAQAIGSGDFSVRVADGFPDEVGSLAGSIEDMRAQLQRLFDALRDDHHRLEQLLDRLDEGVVLVNKELVVEFANDHARELLGAELLESARARAVRRFALEVLASEVPAQLRLTTEDERTLVVSGIPPGAGVDTAIIVIADESQRERVEQAQRDFATNAAHELRTPLASIVTAVEMLQTGAKHDPAVRDEFLGVIEAESARLTRLTRALLVLARADARQEAPKLAALELAGLLEQVAASSAAGDGVKVVAECPPGLAVAAERDLLEQALSNLVANAVQHTRAGVVRLRARAAGDDVAIEVTDSGSGIASPDQARIFDRFYRAGDSEGGFGLGLPIARDAVHALGGDIEIESSPGAGTTVRITLSSARPAGVA